MKKGDSKYKKAFMFLLSCLFFTSTALATEDSRLGLSLPEQRCLGLLRNRAVRTFSGSARLLFRDLTSRSHVSLWPQRTFTESVIHWMNFEKIYNFSNGREIQIGASLEFVPAPKTPKKEIPNKKRQLTLDFDPVEVSRFRLKRTIYLSVTSSTGMTGKPLALEWDQKPFKTNAGEVTYRFKTWIALPNEMMSAHAGQENYYELVADLVVSRESLSNEAINIEPTQTRKLEISLIPHKSF